MFHGRRQGAATGSWPNDDNTLPFDPSSVNLDNVASMLDDAPDLWKDIVCYVNAGGVEYNGSLGSHISALFVVLIVSSAVTFFPVVVTRSKKVRVPLYVYLFARYFGAGVIIATAFIHLLDPAYEEIGPETCVGLTKGWREYSWVPAIALTSGMMVFLIDFAAELYVESKFALAHGISENARTGAVDAVMMDYEIDRRRSTHQGHQHLHSGDQDQHIQRELEAQAQSKKVDDSKAESMSISDSEAELLAERSFQQQIAAFLILEFGVIFHSVIIGLTLGTAGDEFSVLYVVVVFHQSFEGLGIGARLSAIPFPKRLSWMPYALCTAYGLTTPIAIAVGLGVRTTYNPGSNTANIVSGILDATSAGILLYTGFVELLARDFLFNPDRTNDRKQLSFMVFCVFLGAGVMALLGKWA